MRLHSFSFRSKLLLAMMLVVAGVTGATIVLTHRQVEQTYEKLFEKQFATQMQAATKLQGLRLSTITNNCLALAKNVRIQAALGEEATEALYGGDIGFEFKKALSPAEAGAEALPRFYCFLKANGELWEPPQLPPALKWSALKQRLSALGAFLRGAEEQQFGYMGVELSDGTRRLYEVVLTRVRDAEETTGAFVIALPAEEMMPQPDSRSGLLVEGRVYSRDLRPEDAAIIASAIKPQDSRPARERRLKLDGQDWRVFHRRLNSGSAFPAQQVSLYSLGDLQSEQRQFIWIISIFGGVGLVGALALSWLLAHGLSVPIRELVKGTGEIQRGNFEVTVPIRSRDEIGHLTQSFNEMSRGLAEREKFRSVLNKVSDPRVAEQLMREDAVLGGEVRQVSVLFCDIRGFTALTQDMPPAEVIQMLNEHFTPLTRVVNEFHGMVDKFVGDLIMAVFGAPFSTGDDARLAVECAAKMLAERQYLNEHSARTIRMGIGIATGPAVAGCMGSADRLNYTVLGERVNLASRLCGQAGPMEIVIDQTTCERLMGQIEVEPLAPIKLKGFSAPVQAYKVLALRPEAAPSAGPTVGKR